MSDPSRIRALVLVALAPLAVAADAPDREPFTTDFPLAACTFQTTGGNAFLNLTVGRQLYLTNQRCVAAGECDEVVELWITMLPDTKVVRFINKGRSYAVRTRVMEEFESVDGELEEVSRNFVADCAPMHDVYYFGEDTFDGAGNLEPDSWLAGRAGAQPGILMPDRAFLLGSRYYQEIAVNAQDRAEHEAMGLDVVVPAGAYHDCVEIEETSPLEPRSESTKTHCPGVGLVKDGELELTAIYTNATSPSAGN